jgi:rhamnosyltransferase
MSRHAIKVSIVIPTFNAGVLFRDVLESLHRQVYETPIEILVIDSGSTDETLAIAQRYPTRIIQIDSGSFNHGSVRNLGIHQVSGEIIFLLTQDAIPANAHFIQIMVQSMLNENAAGVYARQVPYSGASVLVKRNVENWISGSADRRVMRVECMNDFFMLPPAQRHLYCVFENVASAIRREVWEKIPFPVVAFGEDLDWGFRVLCNGYTLVYEPDAVVSHSHERSAQYTFKRTFIDHYRLYELFSLRTIPTVPKVLRSFLVTTSSDWLYLLRHASGSRRWLDEFIHVPRHAWSGAWGQYRGAKAAASGIAIAKMAGV